MAGIDFAIFTRGERSTLYGAQFLGSDVPKLILRSQELQVSLQGTESEYRTKVYGPTYDGPVSPGAYVGKQTVYDIRQAYRDLWNHHERSINEMEFNANNFAGMIQSMKDVGFSFVFSSIPANSVCGNDKHEFKSTKIYAIGDAPDAGINCPVRVPDRSVVYCGNGNASWYRAASVFGHCTTEWPSLNSLGAPRRPPPVFGAVPVFKPLSTNCNCHSDVVRIGRYGEWKKGVLAHHAFDKVTQKLKTWGIQDALF
jgi:hypothetical protein